MLIVVLLALVVAAITAVQKYAKSI